MGWLDKLKQVAQPTAKIVGAVAPGTVGNVAKIVDRVIADPADPNNESALRFMAEEIVQLKMRVAHLEQFRK